ISHQLSLLTWFISGDELSLLTWFIFTHSYPVHSLSHLSPAFSPHLDQPPADFGDERRSAHLVWLHQICAASSRAGRMPGGAEQRLHASLVGERQGNKSRRSEWRGSESQRSELRKGRRQAWFCSIWKCSVNGTRV
ncbi:unnamed protein product, partial [Urochloa humidicola]